MVMPPSTPGGTSTLTFFVLRTVFFPSRAAYANSTSRLQPLTASRNDMLRLGRCAVRPWVARSVKNE